MANNTFAFKPFNIGRIVVWGSYALIMLVAPLIFTSSLSHTMLNQMGILIIICLSYNILLGQGGMLSFGHAVYSGLGAFVAIHTLNKISSGVLPLPVSLVPIIGGIAGLVFAAIFGSVTVKKAGTPFAMITLGIGELIWAMSLMFPGFFGGEAGITGNRVTGSSPFGITFGPQIQLYYLIAIYTFVCTVLMFALTRTPLGRMLNAVRDNPERVEYIGYDMTRIRYIAFMIAGFFAGIGGGLAALTFEIVTSETVSGPRSGIFLLFTFLGGATFFFGAIIGGILSVLAFVLFSELTKAWLLYLGLFFLFIVMYAPGGIASLIMMNLRVAIYGKLKPLLGKYLVLFISGSIALLGLAAIVEMVYHLQLNQAVGPEITFLNVDLNVKKATSWLLPVAVMVMSMTIFEFTRRKFAVQWGATQVFIENEIKKKESL